MRWRWRSLPRCDNCAKRASIGAHFVVCIILTADSIDLCACRWVSFLEFVCLTIEIFDTGTLSFPSWFPCMQFQLMALSLCNSATNVLVTFYWKGHNILDSQVSLL